LWPFITSPDGFYRGILMVIFVNSISLFFLIDFFTILPVLIVNGEDFTVIYFQIIITRKDLEKFKHVLNYSKFSNKLIQLRRINFGVLLVSFVAGFGWTFGVKPQI